MVKWKGREEKRNEKRRERKKRGERKSFLKCVWIERERERKNVKYFTYSSF